MARPRLTDRRKAQTRRDIAEKALELFMHDGYDAVSPQVIADAAGVSLRTFYRYFATKDDVLVPIVADSVGELVGLIADRPRPEPLGVAVEAAVEQMEPRLGDEGVSALAHLLVAVPALAASVSVELGRLEDALVSVVLARARRRTTEPDARVTAAIVIACVRTALAAAGGTPPTPFYEALHHALGRAAAGAGLS